MVVSNVDQSLTPLFFAVSIGVCISIWIERFMTPRPSFVRPLSAWMLHIGLWLVSYAFLVFSIGRPWFSALAVNAVLLVLVLVNNAKVEALQEPFVFQDYEYFTDAIRHPRLYIPFLGWTKFVLAVLISTLSILVLIWGEPSPDKRFELDGQLGGVLVIIFLSWILLVIGNRAFLPVHFQPGRDILAIGFIASMWRYAQEARHVPTIASPFDDGFNTKIKSEARPHLVAIQSESFFDPRSLFSGVRPDILDEFDLLKQESLVHGKLSVPAWGANTVRTEFSFLSGIDADELGVHQFNPYRALTTGWSISSIASYLKKIGYRTVCIHPYPATFYQRNRVYPNLGFDEFIDIRGFSESQRFGPYISDAAVTQKILEILNQSATPIFVFAITMENHGPLHLEKVEESDLLFGYTSPPPEGFDDLTIYLRHLRNANKMAGDLRRELKLCDSTVGLCWYGDHVPIMPSVYKDCGAPEGDVDFLFWLNQPTENHIRQDLESHQLSLQWLKLMQLI